MTTFPSRTHRCAGIVRIAVCLAIVFSSTHTHAFTAEPLGVFTSTEPMAVAAFNHTATQLADSRVLMTTAQGTQLYDLRTGAFSGAAAMVADHDVASATLLMDGRVLIAGTGFPAPYLTAEGYDPERNVFDAVGDMRVRRYGHEATRLLDGRVLITGGRTPGASGVPLTQAELFDPVTNTFQTAGTQVAPRFGATVSLLQTGDVLLTGGTDGQGHVYASAEVYRAASGTFVTTGSMAFYRVYHAASPLLDGSVLITGGFGSTTGPAVGNSSGVVLATAERYVPALGTFVPVVAVMTTTRQNHTSSVQCDGTVLIAGGQDDYANVLPYADEFDPVTQRFTRVSMNMKVARTSHVATPLADGRTMISGGEIYNADSSALIPTAAVELFEPDLIFRGAFE